MRNSLFEILKSREDEISPRMADLIVGLYVDWLWFDERIESITGEIEKVAQQEPNCRLLMSIPGVGPIISTALVAAIGDGEAFEARPRLQRVAGPHPQAAQHRGKIDPRADLEARRQVPAHAVHPGREGAGDAAADVGAI